MDINQDNGRKYNVSDDGMNFAEQLSSTLLATSRAGQDAEGTEVLLSSDHEEMDNEQDKNGRYERNLQKFLKDKPPLKKIRPRGDMVSERAIKSDGEVAKTMDYGDNVATLSSLLSKLKLKRASAPATCESLPRENPEAQTVEDTRKDNLSVTPGPNEVPVERDETPISVRNIREIQSQINASRGRAASASDFKPTVVPACAATAAGESSKPGVSPGSSKVREAASTPVFKRPTDLNSKPRKAFYMFSPDGSGILRQCQSMPNINREQRKKEKQRRSLFLDERSRIVRSLFKGDPEPSTPETRRSVVPERNTVRPTEATDRPSVASREKPPSAKGPFDSVSLINLKNKICRKLTFAPPNSVEMAKDQPTEAKAAGEKSKSPQKRKERSPRVAERPPESVKKVRISPETSDDEQSSVQGTCIHAAHREESTASDEHPDSSSGGTKAKPGKRKCLERDDSTGSKKK